MQRAQIARAQIACGRSRRAVHRTSSALSRGRFPVAPGDARTSDPDLAHRAVRTAIERLRLDDHDVLRWRAGRDEQNAVLVRLRLRGSPLPRAPYDSLES